MALLDIQNLHVSIEGNEILKGFTLTIQPGEVHSIMGPNGSGKSTLAQVLAGNEAYEVTAGTVTYDGKNLFEFNTEERAQQGVFMAFQYPVEVPGVNNMQFLRASLNAVRKARGEDEIDAFDFLALIKNKVKTVEIDEELLKRSINEGFSGGEKKRFEIFQMSLLEPRLNILDETDSGLDIDALRIVANGVNRMRNNEHGFLVITHYQRLLDYIVPDFIHVMVNGPIVKTGNRELALVLEDEGYSQWTNGTNDDATNNANKTSINVTS